MIDEIQQVSVMRPVIPADSASVGQILAEYVGDAPWKLDRFVAPGSTFQGSEIAVDGSAVIFTVYAGSEWSATETPPIARVLIRRQVRPMGAPIANSEPTGETNIPRSDAVLLDPREPSM